MPGAADFRLYHSNALDVLAGLLAEEIRKPPADGDWLRPDIVLVPQFSMRRWLQQVLAEHSGICANLRFLTPGEFVDETLDRNLGSAPDEDRLAPATLRWHVLRELEQRPPAALQGFLAGGDARKAWSLAGALAETFEKYQAWRRDWLLRWERGAEASDWEAALWRRIARGRLHRARRLDDYLRRFGAGQAAPQGVPPRLFVFACQNVSPDVLQLIVSQARAGTQHFFLHSPARGYWGDLRRWADAYAPARDDAFLGGERPNPLLAAWGQAGRDFVASLGSGEAVQAAFEVVPFVEPGRERLLGRMQLDVLDNTGFDGAALFDGGAWPRPCVDRADASLQFHACHTRLREVQVLHDQLRALLEAPPPPGEAPLQPRDIAVLAPDIDRYAAHIEAVFGGALGTARELPYTIADTSPLASSPLAEAFLRLLELPLRAPSAAEVLDLLAVPAIAARFGLDERSSLQGRGALQEWLEAAGARWGLDARDRVATGAPHQTPPGGDAYTFAFALDRLLLGYATGAEAEITGDGERVVAPWPDLEGQAADTLDALVRFLDLLRDARHRLGAALPPAEWQRTLDDLLASTFMAAHDTADAVVLRRLHDAIAGFVEGAAGAGYEAPVAHAVVYEHLRAELGQADARAPFLSGGICFGRMVPMRLIPFRAICLLGMDEAAFPARDPRDPLNRIATALDTRERRVGDPSRRDADRYLFLQLFASAGRVLYLSWCGMDPQDNSRREPSAVVSELLDAAARYHAGDADTVREALVVRHALQPFSPAAFGVPHEGERLPEGADHEPRRFSHDARWYPAAVEGPGIAETPVFAPRQLVLPARDRDEAGIVSLERLRRALMRPHAVYLQDGLGLRLPEEEPPLPEHEPLGAPDPLGQHSVRQAVFAEWLRTGERPGVSALHARLLARAQVAPGADGRRVVAETLEEIAPFVQQAQAAGFGSGSDRVPFAARCGARELRGTLDQMQGPGVLRVALGAAGLHGGHVVRHGLDWLCASLLGRDLFELGRPGKDAPPTLVHRPALRAEQATALLALLLEAHDSVLRRPLVFLPRSAHAYVRTLAAKDEAAALKSARDCWAGNDRQQEGEASAATRLVLRGRDPFFDEDADARARFAATATALCRALAEGIPFDPAVFA